MRPQGTLPSESLLTIGAGKKPFAFMKILHVGLEPGFIIEAFWAKLTLYIPLPLRIVLRLQVIL